MMSWRFAFGDHIPTLARNLRRLVAGVSLRGSWEKVVMRFAMHFNAFPMQVEDMVGVVLVESVAYTNRSVWDNCFSVGFEEIDFFWHECGFQRFGFEIYERRESVIYCFEI